MRTLTWQRWTALLVLATLGPSPGPRLTASSRADDPARPAPSSRLRTVTWDFGVATPGAELKHRFSITNRTTIVWTVKFVSRTCACTVGEPSARRLKPSESTSLEVALRAPRDEGRVYQSLMVEFQEAGAPLVCLVIKGELRGLLSATPATVDLGRASPGKPLTQSLELGNFGDEDVTVTRVQAPSWLQVEASPPESKGPKGRPRQVWKLVVRAETGKLAPGAVTAELVVHTSSGAIGPARVPVRLHVKGPLDAVPASLAFGSVKVGQAVRRAVMIEVSPELGELSEKDLVVKQTLGEELDVQISRTGTANRFLLAGHYRPTEAHGKVAGELTVRVRDKMTAPLRLPVSGEVR
jgi:hypothetical protein